MLFHRVVKLILYFTGTVPLPLLSLLKEQCNSTQNWVEGNKEGAVQKILAKEKFELQQMPPNCGTLHYFNISNIFISNIFNIRPELFDNIAKHYFVQVLDRMLLKRRTGK